MNLRPLGRSGLKIAPIMLGTNVFGWSADKARSFEILDGFVDAGFNAVDTANSYSRWVPGHKGGESETIIGEWIKQSGKRSKIMLATKVGSDMGEGKTIRKDAILREAEASLKRLQTDVIDLYQTHFDDDVTPPEETLAAYAQLIKDGKVRVIGASNGSPARLKAALAASEAAGIPRYETLQPLYNLHDRKGFEQDYQPLCVTEDISVIPYYALASGFLSGKYSTAEEAAANPARGAKAKTYFDARGEAILKALFAVAERLSATPAQVSLAWLLAQKSIAAPIVSATSLTQLNDILKAADVKLSADDLSALDKASSY